MNNFLNKIICGDAIDINEEYVDISNKRVDIKPYTKESPNEKLKFIISREQILANRKKKEK